MNLHFTARKLARIAFPNRLWFPIEAWGDERYHDAFPLMRAQADDLAAQRAAAADADGPLFTIVVPLFKTPLDYLDDMVCSVLNQTYPNWELILVNASPEIDELKARVFEYMQEDERVKTVVLEGNLGITENTNRGIEIASGDFICFMDHDDWIEPDTLFEYAAAIATHDDIDLIYCDEDMVEKPRGSWRHIHPLFKADFSPELLICKNYIVHFLSVRKSVIDALPRPGSEFDGAQDYNLTLRASEQARRVHHVTKVLYHWRISEQSTATNSNAKPYGKKAYRLSVERHLERTKTGGSIVSSGSVNNYNIWFHGEQADKVSLIVAHPSETPQDTFGSFLQTLSQVNTYKNLEIILVGTELDDIATEQVLCDDRIKHVAASEGASLLERLNAGARNATGEFLVFLDSSCVFMSPEPIEQLLGLHRRAGMGIVGPKNLYADLTVKSYGIGVAAEGIVPLYRGYPLDNPSYQCNMRTFLNASAISYQGLCIKRSLFERLGGFDDDLAAEIGSVMLCSRAVEAGKRVVATCTVNLLTTEVPPMHPFDESEPRPDFPQADIDLLRERQPRANVPYDPYRGPFIDQRSAFPIIDYRSVTRL